MLSFHDWAVQNTQWHGQRHVGTLVCVVAERVAVPHWQHSSELPSTWQDRCKQRSLRTGTVFSNNSDKAKMLFFKYCKENNMNVALNALHSYCSKSAMFIALGCGTFLGLVVLALSHLGYLHSFSGPLLTLSMPPPTPAFCFWSQRGFALLPSCVWMPQHHFSAPHNSTSAYNSFLRVLALTVLILLVLILALVLHTGLHCKFSVANCKNLLTVTTARLCHFDARSWSRPLGRTLWPQFWCPWKDQCVWAQAREVLCCWAFESCSLLLRWRKALLLELARFTPLSQRSSSVCTSPSLAAGRWGMSASSPDLPNKYFLQLPVSARCLHHWAIKPVGACEHFWHNSSLKW